MSCTFCFRLTAPSGVITDGTGNYTTDNKCTWLIESSTSSSSGSAVTPVLPVRLKFKEFVTECSWDHLYIFDGNSVYDPLIAVFRYLLVPFCIHQLRWLGFIYSYAQCLKWKIRGEGTGRQL